MSEFAGKRVTVMGLGRFGGGVGVTRFLADRGADVLVTDTLDAEKLADSVAKLQDLIDDGAVTLRLGEHNVSDFTTCDLVVVNPAVKPGNRFVRAAEAAGIEVTTEIRLLVQRLPNRLRTIGVTGSAGKSTVTAMIGHVLEKAHLTPNRQDAKTPGKARKVWVGGNIGGSLLPHLNEIGEDDWVVLELSSFMLERLRADDHFPGWSPHIAVITNISPNHLDWHGSMEEYVEAKRVIGLYQTDGDFLITTRGVRRHAEALCHSMRWVGVGMATNLPLIIPGQHNAMNASLAAFAVHRIDSLPRAFSAWDEVCDFPGLPHRLQLVAEHAGVRYFNDSKCTTPEATMLAIRAFTDDAAANVPGAGIHLILGGYDKGSDLKPLAGLAREQCKGIYTVGQTGPTIAAAARGHVGVEEGPPAEAGSADGLAEVVECGNLDLAMGQIVQRVKRGDVVLLSPACASWGQFDNYEQRGARFVELVLKYTTESGLTP